MALFEVLTPDPGENFSAIIPSAAVRGIFWSTDTAANGGTGVDSDENLTAKLAAVTDVTLLGFNGRAVTATGLRTDAEILFDEGFEVPDKLGTQCSISRPPLLFAVEDDATGLYLDAGAPPTAVAQLCNFKAGKVQIAQATEVAFYKVIGKLPGIEDATKFRYILERLASAKLA